MRRIILVLFITGFFILVAAFGVGWGNWGELGTRIVVTQILLGVLTVAVIFLAVLGILNRDKNRWTVFLLVAILLLGFSVFDITSGGILVLPVGLLLFGFCIWKLAHRSTKRITS